MKRSRIQHPKQGNKIEEYKNIDISVLKTKSLTELSVIYQGTDTNLQECLISEVKDNLFNSYHNLKSALFDEYIQRYEDAINCFLNFNHVFFIKYTYETDRDEKEAALSFIGSSQVHLTKLQSQYNQLNYRKQLKQYRRSMIIAGVALLLTLISSVFSILGINFPIKKNIPTQIECQCDSTKHMNEKFYQPNKIIKNSCEDTVKKTK